jgi:hypothetical protein
VQHQKEKEERLLVTSQITKETIRGDRSRIIRQMWRWPKNWSKNNKKFDHLKRRRL